MKYIDAEKLKAEIEAREKVHFEDYHIKNSGNPADYGACNALCQIRSYVESLQQEQPEVLSGEDVMTMCNQILIDWVKEGKTQEEKEQREQAHIRFFELYDDYLMQKQPEVDLEEDVKKYFQGLWPGTETAEQCNTDMHFTPLAILRMVEYFYELGLNARKEE